MLHVCGLVTSLAPCLKLIVHAWTFTPARIYNEPILIWKYLPSYICIHLFCHAVTCMFLRSYVTPICASVDVSYNSHKQ